MKEEASEKVPVFTNNGIDCLVDGIKAAVSPSEGDELDDAGKAKVEDIAKSCAEESTNVQGVLSQVCQEEGLISEGCEEEMIDQATEEAGLDEGSSYEETEPYEAEGGYENEGLQEMDQELQQEYEEGKWGPESE